MHTIPLPIKDARNNNAVQLLKSPADVVSYTCATSQSLFEWCRGCNTTDMDTVSHPKGVAHEANVSHPTKQATQTNVGHVQTSIIKRETHIKQMLRQTIHNNNSLIKHHRTITTTIGTRLLIPPISRQRTTPFRFIAIRVYTLSATHTIGRTAHTRCLLRTIQRSQRSSNHRAWCRWCVLAERRAAGRHRLWWRRPPSC